MRDQIVPITAGRTAARGRKIGKPKTGDRTSAVLLDSLIGAFEEVGGQAYLVALARDDPKTFLALLGKVMPYQAKGLGNGTMEITITIGGHES